MPTSPYTVTGMSCANCERHIREEIAQLPDVTLIEVSSATGTLTVDTDGSAAADAAVIAAVHEAGYRAVRQS